nr:hypothetical protein [Desulfobacula sp.]
MKKIIVIVSIIIIAIFFRNVPFALLSPSINGVKCYSFCVTGGSSNGFEYFLYKSPFLTLITGDEKKWRLCTKLNKNINDILESISSWTPKAPYYIVNQIYDNGYSAYIKTDRGILFIRGFPDFGGVAPSEAEKTICE